MSNRISLGVLSVTESNDSTLAVSAVEYNESIYAAVEQDLKFTDRDITNISKTPNAVEGIAGTEFLYKKGKPFTLALILAGIMIAQTRLITSLNTG